MPVYLLEFQLDTHSTLVQTSLSMEILWLFFILHLSYHILQYVSFTALISAEIRRQFCAYAGMREVWKLTQKNGYNKDLYINWESSTWARNLSMECRDLAFNAQGSTVTVVVIVWSSGSRVADMLVACSLMAVHKTGLSMLFASLTEEHYHLPNWIVRPFLPKKEQFQTEVTTPWLMGLTLYSIKSSSSLPSGSATYGKFT